MAIRRTVASAEQATEIARAPLLGVIPRAPGGEDEVGCLTRPASDAAAAYREVLQALVAGEAPPRTVLVTSARPGEGKTTTTACLGVELARTGLSVALVDADLHHPRLHVLFRIWRAPGLTEVTLRQAALAGALVPVDIGLGTAVRRGMRRTQPAPGSQTGRLDVLAAGARVDESAVEVVTRGAAAVLEALRAHHDVVLVDAPPVRLAGYVAAIAAGLDATVLVARKGLTRRVELGDAARRLESAGAVTTGVAVLSGGSRRHRDDGYYDWADDQAAA